MDDKQIEEVAEWWLNRFQQELDKLEEEICKIELDGGTRFLRDKILEVIRQHKQ